MDSRIENKILYGYLLVKALLFNIGLMMVHGILWVRQVLQQPGITLA